MEPDKPPTMVQLFKLARRLRVAYGACEITALVGATKAMEIVE